VSARCDFPDAILPYGDPVSTGSIGSSRLTCTTGVELYARHLFVSCSAAPSSSPVLPNLGRALCFFKVCA